MLSEQYNIQISNSADEEKKEVFKVFLIAFSLRLVMIALIYLLDGVFEPYLYFDDWKYETYARLYEDIATSIIDLDAFKTVNRQIGGVAVAHLYFRFNAVLYYLTKSTLFLRLANILLSSLTIIPIYYISKELFGKKEAKISSVIFACLPYHIIMSAFLFKDILIVLLMSSSLYMIIKFYKYEKMNIVLFLILTIPIEWLRPGMPLFLFGVLGFAIFVKFYRKSRVSKVLTFIVAPILIFVLMRFLFIDNLQLLKSRLSIYLSHGRKHSGNINVIRIDSLSQMYKLPLTWFFSTFFPISFGLTMSDWAGVLGALNYTSIFVAPGYIFYTIFYKKDWAQRVFLYPMLALHLLVIIAVINIPRHYYFLHFYMIICSSAWLAQLGEREKQEYILISILIFMGLLSLSLILR